MKKTFTVAVLYTLVFSAVAPAFSQRITDRKTLPDDVAGRSSDGDVRRVDALDSVGDVKRPQVGQNAVFGTLEALTDGQGVLLRWTMEAEQGNAGFFVYRSDSNSRVNASMVGGSATRFGSRRIGGLDYQFFDPNGYEGASYVISAIGMDGRVVSSSTLTAKWADVEASTGTSSDQLVLASRAEKTAQSSKVALEPTLLRSVEANTLTPDPTMQKVVAAQPGAKIGVNKEGMYRVLRSQLPAAIFDNTNTANWRMFVDGNEQAINVGPNGSYVEFYGKGIDTPETDTHVYYLFPDTVAGKRMATRPIRSIGGNLAARSYSMTVQQKERTTYVSQIQNGDAENYWGRIISSSPDEFAPPLLLAGVDTTATSTVSLTIKLQGYSTGSHSVTPTLNGHALTPITASGAVPYSGQFTVPASYLVDGANSLTLVSGPDLSYFDSVTVSYPRLFQADQNRVAFSTSGLRKINLTGFASSNVRVFDTTIDGTPALVSGFSIIPSGGTYTAMLPASRGAVMYGVEDSGLLQPASVVINAPSALSTTNNAADALIISASTPDLLASANNWATYRRSAAGGNFNVKVVDVADIFDEFNYGAVSAASIKSFLSYANTNWQTKPRYVLLIGDSTVDPRNYEGYGNWYQMPSLFVPGIFEEVASDDALADFDNDGLADISIGRIPMRTGADAAKVLTKTIAYETAGNQSFNRGALLAYDLPTDWDFAVTSQNIKNALPASMPVDMIQRKTDGSTRTPLINSLNTGKLVVNYAGHGSFGLWGYTTPYLFTSADLVNLSTSANPSAFTMLTCLNGYFIRQTGDSLSESLLKIDNGGAVAAWSSTTDTYPDVQDTMGTRFYGDVKAGVINRLGDIARDAKSTVPGGDDVRNSWVVLGDPMLKLP